MSTLAPHRRNRREAGFALLITITLLAFLVLLLVSLASLTRVETQVATNNQQLSQARQNALMALNLALGQLQKAAGADQRVTARADFGEASNAGGANGLVVPADGTRRWTGVWANADTPAHIFVQPPAPRLISWLVSGNENGPAFAADTDGKLTTVPPVADIPFAPDDLTGALAGATATSISATFVGGRPARLLVGPGTVTDVADYVAAPVVDIAADQIPGVGAGTVGRYAWWVGDEGVKAKYNLLDPYHGNLDTATPAGRYRALAAQRHAIERIDGLSSYTPGNANLPRVLNASQITVADAAATPAIVAARRHDLTTYSFGVLADSQAGGLKRDLTYHFEKGGLTGRIVPTPPVTAPHNWHNLWGQLVGPRWEFLRSFYQLADSPRPVVARPVARNRVGDAGTPAYGVFPVVVQVRFFCTLHVGNSGDVHIRVRPMIILGNPFSESISMDGFSYYLNGGGMRMRLFIDQPPPAEDLKLNHTITECLTKALFRCSSALTFEPGELKAFTLSDNVSINGASPVDSEPALVEGVDPSTYIDYLSPVTISPADKARRWVMIVSDGGQMSLTFCERGTGHAAGAKLVGITETGVLGESFTEQRPYNQIPSGSDGFLTQDWGGVIMALRSSTTAATGGTPLERLRPYADHNIRTANASRPWFHSNEANGLKDNPLYSGGYYAAPSIWSANAAFPAWNVHVITDPAVAPRDRLVLHDVPRRAAIAEAAMLSLGYLRHADLTGDSVTTPQPAQPGAAVGNSLAHPLVPRDRSAVFRSAGPKTGNVFDASYLLNTSLWDRYFFSTIPQDGSAAFNPASDRLPSARLRFAAGTSPLLADLQNQEANAGRDRAARHLLVDGAFNVNSTSVEAWTAVLGGLAGLTLNGDANLTGPFPRTLRQPEGSANAGDGVSTTAFAGFRNLTPAQVRQLATKLVEQIRARGPFLSLGQFVNRSLETGPRGLKGALQTAIDDTALNAGFPAGQNLDASNNLPAYADPEAGHGATGTGLPGWLTQADVLDAIGPTLSARSDTFVIRAYGESLNPVTQTTDSRAWCEAVVQRLPDYVDAVTDLPTASPSNPANRAFGRRFQVVSFRWLTASDI